MAVTSEATTLWFGSLTEGHGTTSLDSSDAAEFPVTWAARSEGVAGKTNPEELLGALSHPVQPLAVLGGWFAATRVTDRNTGSPVM